MCSSRMMNLNTLRVRALRRELPSVWIHSAKAFLRNAVSDEIEQRIASL